MDMELTPNINLDELADYLHHQSWITPEDSISNVEKPGEGNMNRVLRVVTSSGSIILKQATDFVVKYPDIPAPISRIDVEQQFYQLVSEISDLQQHQPAIIGYDAELHLMAMEDLGDATDFTFLYQKDQTLSETLAKNIGSSLNILHSHAFSKEVAKAFPTNIELRKLNHQHIFQLPLMAENGFDLDGITPGLQEVSRTYKSDDTLIARASALGEVYLGRGDALLHGDYYPGSWLNTEKGFQLIDPEFCFFGVPEFDLGVLLAHLKLAEQPEAIRALILDSYTSEIDQSLLQQFEGMEIIRRLIGLAQLPLSMNLIAKEELLQYAYHQVMNA